MTLLILASAVVLLALLEVPMSIALGLASVCIAISTSVTPVQVLLIQMSSTGSSFVLLAIPLFIFAGFLMARGGIAEDLVALAELPLRRIRGGLGMSIVVACMFFSGVTGAKVAEVAAISSTTLPALRKRNYDAAYATAIIAAASAAGELIPPAINTIVLGQIMNLSITKLFLAGVIPALVLGGCTLVIVAVTAPPRNEQPISERIATRDALKGGLLALGMPAIIFGGILGGVFSPTEAAASSVLYAFLVVVGFYRRLNVRDIVEIACDAGVLGGALMLLIMTASAFANILTVERVPYLFAEWLEQFSRNPSVLMLVSVFLFLVLGSILEGLPALIIFVPVLQPLAVALKIDLVHFAIVVLAAVGVGLFLPPAGIGFITACSVGKVSVPEVSRRYGAFIASLVVGIVIIVFFPWLSVALPKLIG